MTIHDDVAFYKNELIASANKSKQSRKTKRKLYRALSSPDFHFHLLMSQSITYYSFVESTPQPSLLNFQKEA